MGRHGIIAVVALLLGGCAGSFQPTPVADAAFLQRSVTQAKERLTVTAAVPSRAETKELFGLDLYSRRIQPVWLQIRNDQSAPVAFLPVGLDPEYFTPIESATATFDPSHVLRPHEDLRAQFFFDNKMGVYVEPGATRSGFVFSRTDEGTKSFNVDLATADGQGDDLVTFTFFVPVPGLRVDHANVDWDARQAATREVTEQELIEALEAMPCCAGDKAAEGTADPLNLVVLGTSAEVYYAFIRAGWDETETTYGASAVRTTLSFLTGGEYRYSPVSALYVFDRPQDVAFQKARSNIHERNHLRLWMTDMNFAGTPVWIGQISRDIGVRFTKKTITTHKIDPDVDETREFLLEDLAYSQALYKAGYVEGVGAATIREPRRNLTGDPYFTDGQRLVLWVTDSPVDIADIELLPWRDPKRQVKKVPTP